LEIEENHYNNFDRKKFISVLNSKKYEYINKVSREKLTKIEDDLISLKDFVIDNNLESDFNDKNELFYIISKYLNSILKNELLMDLNITSNNYFTSRVVKIKDLEKISDIIFLINDINNFIIECLDNILYSMKIIIKRSKD